MDLIFWMEELECIQFYLSIFSSWKKQGTDSRMCWSLKSAPIKAKDIKYKHGGIMTSSPLAVSVPLS